MYIDLTELVVYKYFDIYMLLVTGGMTWQVLS